MTLVTTCTLKSKTLYGILNYESRQPTQLTASVNKWATNRVRLGEVGVLVVMMAMPPVVAAGGHVTA